MMVADTILSGFAITHTRDAARRCGSSYSVHNLVSDGFVTADQMAPIGVISYKDRPYAVTEGLFQDMMQTIASINSGNSGRLIDMPWHVDPPNKQFVDEKGEGICNYYISERRGCSLLDLRWLQQWEDSTAALAPKLRMDSKIGELPHMIWTTPEVSRRNGRSALKT